MLNTEVYNNFPIGIPVYDENGPFRYDLPIEEEQRDLARGFTGAAAQLFTQIGKNIMEGQPGSLFTFNPLSTVQVLTVYPKIAVMKGPIFKMPIRLASEDPNVGINGVMRYKLNPENKKFQITTPEFMEIFPGDGMRIKIDDNIIETRAPEEGYLNERPDSDKFLKTILNSFVGKIISPASVLWGEQANRETILFGIYSQGKEQDIFVDQVAKKIFFRGRDKGTGLVKLDELPMNYDQVLKDAEQKFEHGLTASSQLLGAVGKVLRGMNKIV